MDIFNELKNLKHKTGIGSDGLSPTFLQVIILVNKAKGKN